MTHWQWIGDFLQHKKHLSTFPGEGKCPASCPCLRAPMVVFILPQLLLRCYTDMNGSPWCSIVFVCIIYIYSEDLRFSEILFVSGVICLCKILLLAVATKLLFSFYALCFNYGCMQDACSLHTIVCSLHASVVETECVMALQGHPRSLILAAIGSNRKRVYDFLLVINSNLGPAILPHFRGIAGFLGRATPPLFRPIFRRVPPGPDITLLMCQILF